MTSSQNYTHRVWGSPDSPQIWCSEAAEWDHYGEPGTGWGECPHLKDEDGLPLIVHAGPWDESLFVIAVR